MSTQRINYVRVDELGMDPLRDSSFEAILSVQGYQWYTVAEETKFNAALISDIFYTTTDLWYAILYYNGIADNWALKPGLRIKIPAINELTSALSKINSVVTTRRI